MRRGVFDEHEFQDGRKVFRLRWVEEVGLTTDEQARGEFIRFLIRQGKLSERPEELVAR